MIRKKITIGIMTGNSLDGVDAVMTEFTDNNSMRDIAGVSIPYPPSLKEDMLALRAEIIYLKSNMDEAIKLPRFEPTLKAYTNLLIKVVEELIEKSKVKRDKIAAIGLHGQSTGEHNPPSVAGNTEPFTTQIFDAATLAKKTKIPVIYDFRSDDIINGGEGAPLAPMHNRHLSYTLSKQGLYPVCFINGGNTANLAVTTNGDTIRKVTLGYDCGAFNHYIDTLTQVFYDEDYDKDGHLGSYGHINFQLFEELYEKSATTVDGKNFYDLTPPKSSGPHLYKMREYLIRYSLAPEDILRTVEYFAAYSVFLSLQFIPDNFDFPRHFLLCGGGWKNSIVYRDFMNLMHGRGVVLPQHMKIADNIRGKLRNAPFYIGTTDEYGINGQYMEARIFADLAYCYLTKQYFTTPEITGCKEKSILGIICNPNENLRKKGRGYTYSRAAKGWTSIKK